MDILDLSILLLFASVIFIFFIKPFMLKFRKFKCMRCGHCCRLRVKLAKEDIDRLKKSGKRDFIEDKKWLKRINDYCMFLEIKNGKAKCLAYNSRPEVCRWWPIGKFSCDARCKSYYKK